MLLSFLFLSFVDVALILLLVALKFACLVFNYKIQLLDKLTSSVALKGGLVAGMVYDNIYINIQNNKNFL